MSGTERGVFTHSRSTCSIADWGPGPGRPGHQGDTGPRAESVAGSGPRGQGGLAPGPPPRDHRCLGIRGRRSSALQGGMSPCGRPPGGHPAQMQPLEGRERPVRCLQGSLVFAKRLLKPGRGDAGGWSRTGYLSESCRSRATRMCSTPGKERGTPGHGLKIRRGAPSPKCAAFLPGPGVCAFLRLLSIHFRFVSANAGKNQHGLF